MEWSTMLCISAFWATPLCASALPKSSKKIQLFWEVYLHSTYFPVRILIRGLLLFLITQTLKKTLSNDGVLY